MVIDEGMTVDAILGELGQRLEKKRLDMNMSQAALARESCLSKRTVERIEAGRDSQVSSFIRVLRVLRLVSGIDTLVPLPIPSPLALLKQKEGERRRSSSQRTGKAGGKWTWGDE